MAKGREAAVLLIVSTLGRCSCQLDSIFCGFKGLVSNRAETVKLCLLPR